MAGDNKSFVVDLRTGKVTDRVNSGMAGFISWRRLAEQLRRAGEFKANEEPIIFQISERGIEFVVRDVPEQKGK